MGRCYRQRRRKLQSQERPVSNLSQTVIELNQWFQSICRDSSKDHRQCLRLANFTSTGRGLMARERIQPKSVLIAIPLRLLITRSVAENSLCDVLNVRCLPTHHLLAVFLEVEFLKASRSAWEPYLKTIPKSYDVPYFCSNGEISSLPKKYLDLCHHQKRLVSNAYKLASSNVIQNGFSINPTIFSWCWFSVNTRAVYFPGGSSPLSEVDMALAPLLDMFNHTPEVQVKVGVSPSTVYKEGVYTITSTNTSYKKYDQVFINYGPHDNLKLCFEYGFTLNDNPHDAVPIELADLTCHMKNNLNPTALQMITSHNLDKNLSFGPLIHGSPISWNISACLYILMNSDDPSSWEDVFSTDIQGQIMASSPATDILMTTLRAQIKDINCSLAVKLENITSSYRVLKSVLELHLKILQDAISFLCGQDSGLDQRKCLH